MDRARETGQLPPALRDRKFPEQHLQQVWEAFFHLTRSRDCSFGVGYIPVSEIVAYAGAVGVTDVQGFMRLIQAMDFVFVKHMSDKLKGNSKD